MIQIKEYRYLTLIEAEKLSKELIEHVINIAISIAIREFRKEYDSKKIEQKAINIIKKRWNMTIDVWQSISGGIHFWYSSTDGRVCGHVSAPIFKPIKK